MKRSILLAVMLGLAACGQAQVSFSPSKLSDLQVGKTTYDQAVSELGPPTDESKLPDGRRLMTYVYRVQSQTLQAPTARGSVSAVHTTSSEPSASTSAFQLQFDSSGVLQSYTSTPR